MRQQIQYKPGWAGKNKPIDKEKSPKLWEPLPKVPEKDLIPHVVVYAEIVKAEEHPNKKGNGQVITLDFKITQGSYKGRVVQYHVDVGGQNIDYKLAEAGLPLVENLVNYSVGLPYIVDIEAKSSYGALRNYVFSVKRIPLGSSNFTSNGAKKIKHPK